MNITTEELTAAMTEGVRGRFWAYVKKLEPAKVESGEARTSYPLDCWIWLGPHSPGPRFWFRGPDGRRVSINARRLTQWIIDGSLPTKTRYRGHSCHPLCVNPEHTARSPERTHWAPSHLDMEEFEGYICKRGHNVTVETADHYAGNNRTQHPGGFSCAECRRIRDRERPTKRLSNLGKFAVRTANRRRQVRLRLLRDAAKRSDGTSLWPTDRESRKAYKALEEAEKVDGERLMRWMFGDEHIDKLVAEKKRKERNEKRRESYKRSKSKRALGHVGKGKGE